MSKEWTELKTDDEQIISLTVDSSTATTEIPKSMAERKRKFLLYM